MILKAPIINLLKVLIISLILNYSLAIRIYAIDNPNNYQDVYNIAKQLKCMVCNGESIGDSNSDFAISARKFIAIELNNGSSYEMIKQKLIAIYGEEISLEPSLSLHTIILWTMPCFMMPLGLYILYRKLQRAS